MANSEYIEMLIKRDKAMPVKKYEPITEGIDPWAMCPVCGRLLLDDGYKFCDRCGQRVLIDTWEIV